MKRTMGLILSLLFAITTYAQLTLGVGYHPTEKITDAVYTQAELSFRIDVDRDKSWRESDIIFLVGGRLGYYTTTSDIFDESKIRGQIMTRGYGVLFNKGDVKWSVGMEYDYLNDDFSFGPGLHFPIGEGLSLDGEMTYGLWNGKNFYADNLGARIELRYRIGN